MAAGAGSRSSLGIDHRVYHSLAHNLQLQVVAEGVETAVQLDYLQQQRCDAIQGYYFSRPVEAGQFHVMLEEGKCLPIMKH